MSLVYYDKSVAGIETAIPGMKVDTLGGACPFQVEGTMNGGRQFYARYRHDQAQMWVAPIDGDVFDDCTEYASVTNAFDADCDRGDVDADEAVDLIVRLYESLSPAEDHVRYEATLAEHVQMLSEAMKRADEIHQTDLELRD